MCAMGEPTGPMLNGITYRVRPFMQPAKSPSRVFFISAGSVQLLVGPGVLLLLGADEGPILDARDVGGVGPDEEAVRPLALAQLTGGAALHHEPRHLVVLLLGAVAPMHLVGLTHGFDLLHRSKELLVLRHRCLSRLSVGVRRGWPRERASLYPGGAVVLTPKCPTGKPNQSSGASPRGRAEPRPAGARCQAAPAPQPALRVAFRRERRSPRSGLPAGAPRSRAASARSRGPASPGRAGRRGRRARAPG